MKGNKIFVLILFVSLIIISQSVGIIGVIIDLKKVYDKTYEIDKDGSVYEIEKDGKKTLLGKDGEIRFGEGDRVYTRNDQGKPATVKVVEGNHFSIKNANVKTGENIVIETFNQDTEVIFSELVKENTDKFIRIVDKGDYKEVKVAGETFKVKHDQSEGSRFVLDENRKLKEGTKFKTTQATFVLRGYEVPLPENSVVEYFKDRIVVSVPPGSEIVPKIKAGESAEGYLEIKTSEPGSLKTKGGNFQALKRKSDGVYQTKDSTLFYKHENGKMQSYFEEKDVVFLNEKGVVDFSIINPNAGTDNPRVDLVFDEGSVGSNPAVLVKSDRIGSIHSSGKGPIINIGPGNRLGVGVDESGVSQIAPGKKTLSFQGVRGSAIIRKGEKGKVPIISLKGSSIYGPDRKSFFGGSGKKLGKFYFTPSPRISFVEHGTSAVPLQVEIFNENDKKYSFDILTNNRNQHAAVSDRKLKDPYFVAKKGTIVSPRVAFNHLSPKSQKIVTELDNTDRGKIIALLDEGDSVSSIETAIGKIKPKPGNPLYASVSLNGCSGTIVGGKDGKFYVLTAAHCVNGVGSYRSVYLNSLTSSNKPISTPIYGKVVVYSSRGGNKVPVPGYSGYNDIALLEISPNAEWSSYIKQRGFAQIAPLNSVGIGSKATLIGCPSFQSSFGVASCRVNWIFNRYSAANTLQVNRGVAGGYSGGGLFDTKGRLIGVTQSGGASLGSPLTIHSTLGRTDFSFLLKITLIFIFDLKE